MKAVARTTIRNYVIPLLAVLVALAITASTSLRADSPFLLFLAAIMVSAWIGGLISGLVATLLSLALDIYLILPPQGSFTFEIASDVLRVAVFVFVGLLISFLTAARERAEEAAHARARQQAAVADLGQRALAGDNLPELLDYATRLVCETLGVEYCKVLELLPNGRELLLRAGHGWMPGSVGHAKVGAESDSQAGYVLASNEPVIVRDLRTETRFHGWGLLLDHNVVSGMSVIIPGPGRPFGVLGAHSTRRRIFTRDDIHFLSAVANVMATAIERHRHQDALAESRHRLQALFDSATDAILVADDQARHVDVNSAACELTGYTREELLGTRLWDLIPPARVESVIEAWMEFMRTGRQEGEYVVRRKDGTLVEVEYRSVANMIPGLHLSLLRDVTERKQGERQLAAQYAVTRVLAEAETLATATPQILQALAVSMEADIAAIWSVDREADVLRCFDIWNAPEVPAPEFVSLTRELILARDVGLAGRIWSSGHPEWMTRISGQSAFPRAKLAARYNLESGFGFPIFFRGEFTGVIEFFTRAPRLEDAALTEMMGAFGSQIGQFIERKRTEEALRISREQQSIILQGVEDGITAQTPNGTLIYANDAAARMIGFDSPQELIETPVDQVRTKYQLADENGAPYPWDQLPSQLALHGQAATAAVRFGNAETGEERWALVSSSPVFDDQGRVQFAINISHDITERKRAEEQLRGQGELLRVTLSSIADAVISTDAMERIQFMNPVAESLTGWRFDEARGQRLDQVLRFADAATRAEVPSPTTKVLQHQELVISDERVLLIHRDGSQTWVDASAAPIRDERNNLVGSVVVFRDITERQQAEQKALHLAAIVNSSDDAIFSKTIEGAILTWNPGAERLYGYSAAEMVGQSVSLLYPRNQLQEFEEITARLRRGEPVEHHDVIRLRKDGRPVHVSISISLLKDARGKIIGASTIARDISERIRNDETQRLLTQASEVLSSSLDYETTLRSLARLAVPQIADWCSVHMVTEDGAIEQLALAHVDPAKVEQAEELQRRYPTQSASKTGVPQVIRSGKPELVHEVTDEQLAAVARDAEHLKMLVETGIRSYMVVPLIAQGRTLGAIALISAESGRRYGPSDLALAQDLARRAALSVDNARLYRQSQTLNEELEQRVVKRTVELQQANLKLERQAVERERTADQMRRLSAHLQSAREEERIRIAREIHDEIGQVLTAVKMDLNLLGRKIVEEKAQLNPEALVEDITATTLLVDETIQIMHEIIRELRPEILDHLGLEAAIEWQLQDFQRRTEIECRFSSAWGDISIDLDRSTAIFRIFQETLSNVARHAKATQVETMLSAEEGALVLEVRDDGQGITEQDLCGLNAFGILGMRERAHVFGGEVLFKGVPGQGTTVTVRIPQQAGLTIPMAAAGT